jgi:flagellar biosynthesis regulator FlaF
MRNAYSAYEKSRNANPRLVEAELFRLILATLRSAQETRKPAHIADAVVRVKKLWHALLADMASEGNVLPPPLKKGLASVGLALLRECDAHDNLTEIDLDFLIALNENILLGLEGQARSDKPPAA